MQGRLAALAVPGSVRGVAPARLGSDRQIVQIDGLGDIPGVNLERGVAAVDNALAVGVGQVEKMFPLQGLGNSSS